MSLSLLIVTPQAEFGASIRVGLDSARFDLFCTSDFTEAIRYVRNNDCPAVILDAELENVELSVMDIGFALRQMKPDLRFVLVRGAEINPDADSLAPIATFTKPLSMPDLNRLLETLILPTSRKPKGGSMNQPILSTANPVDTSGPGWLKDVSKAAQHLTRLTLESSAQAALITRQTELWAYAGQLSREAAQEITDSLQNYWAAQGESDLLRFVRLRSTDAQHMLYARKLAENILLALVFDAETPFSTIRSQANKLIKNLSENSPVNVMVQPASVVSPAPVLNLEAESLDDDEAGDLPPISQLLGDVPPPIPPRPTQRSNHPQEMRQRLAVDEPATVPPPSLRSDVKLPVEKQFSMESSPPIRRDETFHPVPVLDETVAGRLTGLRVDPLAETRVGRLPDELQETRKQETSRESQSGVETRPQVIAESMTEAAHRILLEPASPTLVNLTYAFLLIPRFDNHHLVGDAAGRLNEWVPQLCVAFAWRLEFISVRPDYLQWVVRVPPNTAPGYVIRVVRQQTSTRIFAEFPRFKADNPSEDFWAPGYLIMGSSEPHPHQLVRDFIKRTRGMQGLIPRE
jgi:REP element-mobilizing transposase RayT